ncbi:MAG: FliH/SctL family protein [Planctomycetota bacterium]|jgi:flagellar biosynthesis/type III secretory pathway protein FliH
MTHTLTIHLEKPITSAKFLDESTVVIGGQVPGLGQANSAANAVQIPAQDSEVQDNIFPKACQAINSVVTKLNQFYEQVFAEQKEEIAKLSVEIARKILMQKVEDGDYEIQSIVKEALNKAPTQQDIVVHLNPEDLAECQKALQNESDGTLTDVKFVSDSNIGRAECLLESPKGIVESMINEHLDRISKALKKAE